MISICIPTYNRLFSLKRCLNSIIDKMQDYPYEIIIADGGSIDGTIEYIKNLKKENVKIIEQGKLTGTVKAFNECFKIAKGNNIFIFTDDMTIKSDVIIKACKLLDEDQQIGLVAPKIQEIIHGNLPGVTNRIKSYGVLLSKIHIIRKSVLDKMGFFDEKFRTYHIDDDSCLSVLNLGYTIIFTKDVGVIHYRIRDEKDNEARAISTKKLKDNSEKKYFEQKWKNIEKKIEKIDKIKYLKYTRRCDIIYFSNILSKFVPKSIYDIFLEKSIIFNDKKYNDLRDFYLAQKYPVEIIRNS